MVIEHQIVLLGIPLSLNDRDIQPERAQALKEKFGDEDTVALTDYHDMLADESVTAAFAAMTDEATTQAAMQAATASNAYIPLFYNTYFYAFDSDLNYGPFYNEISGFLYRDFSWKD